ncbi:helix-turn-helix domain-containing protein [Streptomyces sp. NPDC059578]|uniref:helix-turn-helix domain-containing protein n=1 Tax=unclassified Streptomyces TaxID=2593676 RepID=UPI003646EC79
MPAPDDGHIGTRIKEQRRLAHLNQRQLADRLPYSYSLLNQVECGARRATPDFVSAVADVLGIDAALLTSTMGDELHQDHPAAVVAPIREALDIYDLEPLPEPVCRPVAVLAAEADRVCQLVRAARLRKATGVLPGVIAELTHLAWTAPTTPVWRALASTYRTAHDITLKLGHPDLSQVALDRMYWAAERASDPHLAAVRQYKRALLYKSGSHSTGLRLIAEGHRLLEGETTREALAVSGQLHLGASALAARAGEGGLVDAHLASARNLAARVGGEAPEVHWLSFGARNADLHAFGAAVAMGCYDDALSRARSIRVPPSTLTSRRARFLVDRARAEMETGHLDSSLRHLAQARHVAPEQTRYYSGTKETITGLVHLSRRTPDSLAYMARWVGI